VQDGASDAPVVVLESVAEEKPEKWKK